MSIIQREISQAYEQLKNGHDVVFDEQELGYERFINWLYRKDKKSAKDYWQKQLHGFDQPTPLEFNSKPIILQRTIGSSVSIVANFEENLILSVNAQESHAC